MKKQFINLIAKSKKKKKIIKREKWLEWMEEAKVMCGGNL